jgi:hypothetical protein
MARYLEHVGSVSPFNFSSAQVITKWMVEFASSSGLCLAPAVGPVSALYDSFALKSGHGFAQLWSTLITVIADSTVLERFSRYESVMLESGRSIGLRLIEHEINSAFSDAKMHLLQAVSILALPSGIIQPYNHDADGLLEQVEKVMVPWPFARRLKTDYAYIRLSSTTLGRSRPPEVT